MALSTHPNSRVEQVREKMAALSVAVVGSPERQRLTEEVVALNTPLVRYVADRYRTSSEPFEDLFQVGMVGLVKAIARFDPDRGVDFGTFAIPTVDGEIKRYFRDSTWAVHVPRRFRELQTKIGRVTAELNQQLGRTPTNAEVAQALTIDVDELALARHAGRGQSSRSLDALSAERGSFAEPSVEDEALSQVELRGQLGPAIRHLTRRERVILGLRFVDDLTQAEIARVVGLSQMQVSRVLSATLAKLRLELTQPPADYPLAA